MIPGSVQRGGEPCAGRPSCPTCQVKAAGWLLPDKLDSRRPTFCPLLQVKPCRRALPTEVDKCRAAARPHSQGNPRSHSAIVPSPLVVTRSSALGEKTVRPPAASQPRAAIHPVTYPGKSPAPLTSSCLLHNKFQSFCYHSGRIRGILRKSDPLPQIILLR